MSDEAVLRVTEAPEEADWRELAACRGLDTELFFPGQGGQVIEAIAVCATCPVRLPCLEAGHSERFGIWGGMSEKRRRTLRRQRAVA